MLGWTTIRIFFCPPPFQPSQCWEQIVGVMLLCSMLEINDVVLYCIVLYCIVLYCIVLYCIVLYCIVLYCIVLYCIVLYCIVLYCIVLYCIVTNIENEINASTPLIVTKPYQYSSSESDMG